MIYSLLLGLHITAACMTGIFLAFTLYGLKYNRTAWYRACAFSIGFIAAFEVFSGTLLAILSPELSAAALSLHIAAYLGICFLVESLLFVRMRKIALLFPTGMTASPVLTSILSFMVALSFHF